MNKKKNKTRKKCFFFLKKIIENSSIFFYIQHMHLKREYFYAKKELLPENVAVGVGKWRLDGWLKCCDIDVCWRLKSALRCALQRVLSFSTAVHVWGWARRWGALEAALDLQSLWLVAAILEPNLVWNWESIKKEKIIGIEITEFFNLKLKLEELKTFLRFEFSN